MLVLYRIGAHVPVPGIPFQGMLGLFQSAGDSVAQGAMALLNLFSGGALSYVSVFSLGIMPYITSSIILQMLQSVVPSLHELAREGEVWADQDHPVHALSHARPGRSLNAIGYLFLFKSFGISFNGAGAPEIIFDIMIVGTLVAGAMLIMWIGELITQRGIGNGMTLIIFANIMAGLPQAILQSIDGGNMGVVIDPSSSSHHPVRDSADRLHRARPAPHSGAVRQARGRSSHHGRPVHLSAHQGQHCRRHPDHLRERAAVLPGADRGLLPATSAGFRRWPMRCRPAGSTGSSTWS